MPTYDYVCDACEHTWEEFRSITSKPTRKCPECGKPMLIRMSRRGPFQGCSGYPECKKTLPAPRDPGEAPEKAAAGAARRPAKKGARLADEDEAPADASEVEELEAET